MSPKTISKWQIILIWGMSLTYNLKGKGICTVIINNRTFYLKIQELTVSQVKFFSVWGKLSMKCEGILMFHMGQKLFSFSQDTKVRGEKYNKFYQECVSLWHKHLRQLCFLLSDSWVVTRAFLPEEPVSPSHIPSYFALLWTVQSCIKPKFTSNPKVAKVTYMPV